MLWRRKPKKEPNARSDATEDNAEYRWDDGKWSIPQYEHWYAGNSDYQADERRYWRHQVRAIWSNVGIGIATLIAAISAAIIAMLAYGAAIDSVTEARKQTAEAKRQADAAVAQVDIAYKALTAVQRAFIVLTDAEPVPVYDVSKTNIVAWQFTPAFENAGATGTESLHIFAVDPHSYWEVTNDEVFKEARKRIQLLETMQRPRFTPLPRPKDKRYFAMRDFATKSPNDPEAFSTSDILRDLDVPSAALGPKQKILLPGAGTWTYEITIQELSDAQSDKLGRFFYGFARYTDIFQQEHVTKYCFRIDGLSRGMASEPIKIPPMLCRHWNCVDDQCAKDRAAYDAEVAKIDAEWNAQQQQQPANPPK